MLVQDIAPNAIESLFGRGIEEKDLNCELQIQPCPNSKAPVIFICLPNATGKLRLAYRLLLSLACFKA